MCPTCREIAGRPKVMKGMGRSAMTLAEEKSRLQQTLDLNTSLRETSKRLLVQRDSARAESAAKDARISALLERCNEAETREGQYSLALHLAQERIREIEAESFARSANRLHKEISLRSRALFLLVVLGGTAIAAYAIFLALVALGVIP